MKRRESYDESLREYRSLRAGELTVHEQLRYLTSDTDVPYLIFEPMFRRHMARWEEGVTLDSFYFALEALFLCDAISIVRDSARELTWDYMKLCHIPRQGGFWTTPFGTSASLYATVCAIGIMKSLSGARCQMPLVHVKSSGLSDGPLTLEELRGGAAKLLQQHATDDRRSFFDVSSWPHGCVMSCSMASSILWNLGFAEDEIFRYVDENDLAEFLTSCMHRVKTERAHLCGFKPHPEDRAPGLSVTYHVLRLVQRLKWWDGEDEVIGRLGEKGVSTREILRFYKHCWSEIGFSPMIGLAPSLMSTYYALASLVNVLGSEGAKFAVEKAADVARLVQECESKTSYVGLYSATPGMAPSAAATRFAVQIGAMLERLGQHNPVSSASTSQAIAQHFWLSEEGFISYPKKELVRIGRGPVTGKLLTRLAYIMGVGVFSSANLLRKVAIAARARLAHRNET